MTATTKDPGYGGHRSSSSTSGTAILASFIPALVTAIVYVAIFVAIRNRFRKIYAPRTFLGPVLEEHRTPHSTSGGRSWFYDFRNLSDYFVLQHNSLDAYLYLRFLKFIAGLCLVGCCITWPILIPVNAAGGGTATQLDRISFSNIAKNDYLWAHVVVAWVFFGGIMLLIARERLQLIGIRQAYLLEEARAARLSSRTVLFLNASSEACQPENLQQYFGDEAERSWPVRDSGDLDELIAKRNGNAYTLEKAEMDLVIAAVRQRGRTGAVLSTARGTNTEESQSVLPRPRHSTSAGQSTIDKNFDRIEKTRAKIGELGDRIEACRSAPSRNIPAQSAIFVAFSSQAAAHRAHERISFPPKMAVENRFLNIQPKEVLWKNVAMPVPLRMSKASLGLAFMIVFTIFFSIPVGIIGTISNANYLANRVKWLEWLNDLPPVALGLLTGLLPPFLTSWFVSYVPKLFRHIAKLSGEPTIPQAELKTQAWYFAFQVFQVFLVTTFSSGAASVITKIGREPQSTPNLLAEGLPKSSNFYLTYFILQGTASAANTILNYSDLFEYLFYEYFWDKSPREKFNTYAKMKGTPWASWYPKFTNFLVIGIAYSCVAPLVLGFAAIGLLLYYLTYRYQLLYVCLTKTDTRGEAYKRALQQMPTGVYIAELCLIGLLGARKATVQTVLMIVLLLLTALVNLLLDRTLRPLEIYLGVDTWQEQEVPLLADEDGIAHDDQAALHAASHGRRLGLKRLPKPAPRIISDICDSIISKSRTKFEAWANDTAGGEIPSLSNEDLDKAFLNPALTSKIPKLWIPRDSMGISKQEIAENEASDIPTSDEAAEIDDKGKLQWDRRFENVPIWKKPRLM